MIIFFAIYCYTLWSPFTQIPLSTPSSSSNLSKGGTLIWVESSNDDNIATSIATDNAGIYIVGQDGVRTSQWRIEKRNPISGSIVWTQLSNPSAYGDEAHGVVLDKTGVYIIGYETLPAASYKYAGDYQWRIEKRNLNDGSLIWVQNSNPSNGFDKANGIAVDSAGIYVVGYTDNTEETWRIEKRNIHDGSIIWVQTPQVGSYGFQGANGVSVDSSGVYIIGTMGFGDYQWRIEKRNLNDGSLIWVQNSNPSNSYDKAEGITIDNSGLYVIGYEVIDYGQDKYDYQWRIEKRNLNDGSLIWVQNSNPSPYNDEAYGIASSEDGIYAVGYGVVDYKSPTEWNHEWRIEKRNLNDGSLIWVRKNDPSPYGDEAYGVTIDNKGIYIVGQDGTSGENIFRWRVEKREK